MAGLFACAIIAVTSRPQCPAQHIRDTDLVLRLVLLLGYLLAQLPGVFQILLIQPDIQPLDACLRIVVFQIR